MFAVRVGLGMRSRRRFHRGWWPRAPREAAPWRAVHARLPGGCSADRDRLAGWRTPGHGRAVTARAAVLAWTARFCLAGALIARASTPPAPWKRSTGSAGGGPWIQRLADPPARSRYRVSGWGGRRRSTAPAARPFAGTRSSSPLPSGGAGTTGTGAVRGRTRRPTSPAAAGGRDQQSRGRGWPWLPYPAPDPAICSRVRRRCRRGLRQR